MNIRKMFSLVRVVVALCMLRSLVVAVPGTLI